MFTIAYKTDDDAQWKTNGETYKTKEQAMQDALDWLDDGYIIQIVEL
jgi:hypothetical protein